MSSFRLFLISLGLLLGGVTWLPAQTVDGLKLTESKLLFDAKAAVPGETVQVGIHWKMAPGYHLYYKYPGDSGQEPRITWTLPEGVTIGEIRWPLPELHKDRAENETYIYPDEVLLAATLTLPKEFAAEKLEISAKADWLVCEVGCYDGQGTFQGSLPISKDGSGAAPDNSKLFMYWEQRVPTLTAMSNMPLEDFTWSREGKVFTLLLKGLKLPEGAQVWFIPTTPPPAVLDHPSAPQPAVGEVTIKVPAFTAPETVKELDGVLVADLPAKEVTKGWPRRQSWVLTKLPTSDFGKNDGTSLADKLAAAPTFQPPTPPAGGGDSASLQAPGSTPAAGGGGSLFFTALGLAFLGGLVLNVMPCVLPAISLKILGFIQDANEEPRKVALMGLAFTAGVFTFFMGIAVLSVSLTAGGQGLGWGMQFQYPWFVGGMAVIMLLFALNLFGLFEINLPGTVMQGASQAAGHGGFWGAYVHGLLATLLATACTAPAMGAALGATIGQPAWFTVAVLAALALGMSTPYLLLALRPRWLKFLPRPGAWMESVKQFMGFLLLATVVWLLYVYSGISGEDAVFRLLMALLGVSAAVWFFGVARPGAKTAGGKRFALGMALVTLAGSGWYVLAGTASAEAPDAKFATASSSGTTNLPAQSVQADGEIEWIPWSPAVVEQAVSEGRVVFIDFTARWCTNCLANKKLVVDTPPIKAAFSKHKVLAVKADWTRRDEETRKAIQGYGRVGIPLNVVYGPGLADGKPLILPELLTQDIVTQALEKAGGGMRSAAL
jgi:thiol:disulfide interchange protein/DsbC/DsbD-like thiol-disulfide interchange protein